MATEFARGGLSQLYGGLVYPTINPHISVRAYIKFKKPEG